MPASSPRRSRFDDTAAPFRLLAVTNARFGPGGVSSPGLATLPARPAEIAAIAAIVAIALRRPVAGGALRHLN